MSDPQKTLEKTAPARREQIRVRLNQLRRSRQHGMFGVPEIVGLVASGVMVLAVVFSYFYFLTPARARLKTVQAEFEYLKSRINIAKQGVDPDASPQSTVDEINLSLERFERGALSQRAQGRRELYDQLNEMMRRHSLRNTAGPVYTSLDPLGTGAPTSASKAGNARWQSLYPGIGIAVTVEGQYANLRHFLREIESSKQFIVVNAVELEGVTDTNSPTGATLVSLRLDMATYFQRETAMTDVAPTTETR
jgi:Tfp pilus assembly protein PilO